jgi:hypothetical protein
MMKRMCLIVLQVTKLPSGVSLIYHRLAQHTCNLPALPIGQGGKEYLLKEYIAGDSGTSLRRVVHPILLDEEECLVAITPDEFKVEASKEAHIIGGNAFFTERFLNKFGYHYLGVRKNPIHHPTIIDGADLSILRDERSGEDVLRQWMGDVYVPVHMQERFCLQAVGLDFRQGPVLGQTRKIVEDHLDVGIRQVQLIDEDPLACRVRVEHHLVVVLA